MGYGCRSGLRNVRKSPKGQEAYAYLTYFAGGKGRAWPSFNHLSEKLHVSRRYVITLVQELSGHRLITVTNIHNPQKGYCANVYRFLTNLSV